MWRTKVLPVCLGRASTECISMHFLNRGCYEYVLPAVFWQQLRCFPFFQRTLHHCWDESFISESPWQEKSCSTPAGWLLTLRKPSPIMTLQFSYYAHWIIDGRPNVSSWLHCLAAKLKMASNRIAETVLIGPFWLWLSSLLRDITTVRWSHNIFSKPMWMQWMQLWYLNFGAPTFAPPVPMLLPISWTQPTCLSLGMHRNNWCNFWKQLQCHVTQWPSKNYQKPPHPSHILLGSLSCWWIWQQDWRMHCCMC